MKALKIIGIIVGVMAAAILIVPLFIPATAEVSSDIEISLDPAQIFPSVASFNGRESWDPWVASDSTTVVTIESKPGYVGSIYTWKGEKLGTGKMEVIEVKENAYIKSNLWFMGGETPSLVEWDFEAVEGGTRAEWSFAQETTYPFGRLGMLIGKVFLKQSFDSGLASLKKVLEAVPPKTGCLGPINIEIQQAFEALVGKGAGTMEEMAQQLGSIYGKVFAEAGKQQLEVNGPAFVHYLDYDEATGFSNFLAGVPVNKPGKGIGEVLAKPYGEMKVVRALHTGPYEEFEASYGTLDQYIRDHGLETTGEAFEFYQVSMNEEQNPAKWQTLIAFPLD